MSRLLFAVLLVLALPAHAQTTSVCGTNPPVTVVRGQELKAFAVVINQQTACLHEYKARIEKLEQNLSNVIWHHDTTVRWFLAQACAANEKIPGWVSRLPGIEPVTFGPHIPCPVKPYRLFPPQYINAAGPEIPPPVAPQ